MALILIAITNFLTIFASIFAFWQGDTTGVTGTSGGPIL